MGNITIDPQWIHSDMALHIAIAFSTLASVMTLIHVFRHICNYTMPGIQVYVIRIQLIVPIYAISSAIALSLDGDGMYAEAFRDIYEAFVIYTFLNLMLEFCGGETDCIYNMENEERLAMPFPFCRAKWPRDARLVKFCQRGVVQFVLVKVVMAIVDSIMIAINDFENKAYQFVLAFIYNTTYTVALYCLVVFYYATKHQLHSFKPFSKFLAVKVIIFLTYFQSVGVSFAPITVEEALMWNDFILCCEMVFFSIGLMVAFPVEEFQGGMPESRVLESVKEVISVADVWQDVYHSFNDKYSDYSVQRQDHEDNVKVAPKGRLRGLDNAAVAMQERYRGRNKRLEFNALLRGSKPIQAKMRSGYPSSSSATADGATESLIGNNSSSTGGTSSSDDLNAFGSVDFDHDGSFGDVEMGSVALPGGAFDGIPIGLDDDDGDGVGFGLSTTRLIHKPPTSSTASGQEEHNPVHSKSDSRDTRKLSLSGKKKFQNAGNFLRQKLDEHHSLFSGTGAGTGAEGEKQRPPNDEDEWGEWNESMHASAGAQFSIEDGGDDDGVGDGEGEGGAL
jgi:hypothetical protein